MQSAVLTSHVVRPSVTLVDQVHIDWKSWKLTARTISPAPSLFGSQRSSTYSSPRVTWGNLGENRGGVGKIGVLKHKSGNISETCKERKSYYGEPRAYRKAPALFRMVPSSTLYGLPFPKIRVLTPPKTPIAIISGTGKARNFKFGQYIQRGSIQTKAH